MNIKQSEMNDLLPKVHAAFKNIIFDSLGIVKMKNSDLFISGWYVAVISLAYSLRILRTDINYLSIFTLIMTIILIILLSIDGLAHGHFKNKISGIKK